MPIEIFDSGLRLGLQIGLAAALVSALGLALIGRARLAAFVSMAAGFLGLALLVELVCGVLATGATSSAVDFNEYRWVFLSPWGRPALITAALASLLIVVATGLSTRRVHSPWRWALIVGLRGVAVATAMVLFIQPAIELRQVAREPNRIAILVDDSESMELSDQRGKPNRREVAAKVLRDSKEQLDQWSKSHIIDTYRFSDELVQANLDVLTAKDRGESSAGESTLLRHALEQLRRRYDADELAGVVLLSDGVVTGDLAEIGAGEFRDFIQELDTPIHTLWAASPGLKDMAVSEIRADEFAFVRSVTRIEAVVHSTGYKKRRIPVTLSSDGKAMRRKWIEVGPGDSSVVVSFEFTPPHVGKYVYKVSIPVDDQEAVPTNNSSWFVVRVIRDKIRVLQVAGQPSWDVRALRGMLKQNPNVDLISFFILRTPVDIKKADDSELSLIPFPTRELFEQELPSFDLVVLQNFNYGPYGIGRYLENIRSYVEGGGGLMMLGGPLSFSSGGYANTPVAKVLPVELPTEVRDPTLLDTSEFRPRLTELGGIHPVTALRYEANDNRQLWKTMPLLEGVNKVLRAKEGASVLAVHPNLKDSTGQPMPVVVAGNYKEGRSLAVTTDSLWKWGFVAASEVGNDGRHYLRLWDNAIRWLIQDPELRYLHVDSDRNAYAPSDTVRLNLRLLDQDYSPLSGGTIKLKVSRGFDPASLEEISTETLKAGEDGEVSHQLASAAAGVYRVHAEATVRGRQVTADDIFLVHQASTEHQEPAGNDEVLRMVSQLSEGEHLGTDRVLPGDLRFIAPKIVRVDQRSDVPLWSLSWLLLLALAALGLEWLLRQRSGTL